MKDQKKEEVIINNEGNTRTFIYPNAKVRVHFADISDEENERRMKKIHKAAEELLKERIKKNKS